MADQGTRYAGTAERFLDDAAGDALSGRRESQPAALQGIGYALLAVGDRLGAVLDAADDRNAQLEQIREAVEMLHREPRLTLRQWLSGLAWRLWGARRLERAWRREAAWRTPVGTFTENDITIIVQALAEADERHRALGASTGCAECDQLDPGKCPGHGVEAALADMFGGLWARLTGNDAIGPAGTQGADLPVWGPEFVLSGTALATVRQALVDAAEWRQRAPDGAGGCGEDARCPDHFGDQQLASAYADLLVRLLACMSGGDLS